MATGRSMLRWWLHAATLLTLGRGDAPDGRCDQSARTFARLPQPHVLLQSSAAVSRLDPDPAAAERRTEHVGGEGWEAAARPDVLSGNAAIQTGFVTTRSAGQSVVGEHDENEVDTRPMNVTAAADGQHTLVAKWVEGMIATAALVKASALKHDWHDTASVVWQSFRNTTLLQTSRAALAATPESAGATVVIVCVIVLICGLVFFSMSSFVHEEAPKDNERSRVAGKESKPSQPWSPVTQLKSSASIEAASARSLLETPLPKARRAGGDSPLPAPAVPRQSRPGFVPQSAPIAETPPARSSSAYPPTRFSNSAPAAVASAAALAASTPPPPAIGEAQGSSSSQLDAREEEQFCPSLVVPSGMEFIFAVRQVLTKERQMTAFSVVDLRGQPLSHVIANERGAQSGLYLQTLNKTPLAMVRTGVVHERPGSLPEICRPSGEVFCTLVCDGTPNCGRYLLRHSSGQHLLTFAGDFREKATNVVNTNGRLVCATERCHTDFDGAPHYQVRVAPHVDAGLVLCGLLAIDKLEGSSRGAAAGTTFADIA